MNIQQLQDLLAAAARPAENVNFSDVQSAAKNALLEYFGIEELSVRDIKKYGPEVFALIEEVVERVLPAELEERIGQFAEIKTYARDEQVRFVIKGVGKNRVLRGIVPGARGGLYRARRLDDKEMFLPTRVFTVAYQITLEELLTGRRTIAELVEIIAQGFVEIVYMEVFNALQAAPTGVNSATGNGLDEDKIRDLVRIVSAYGSPIIITFRTLAEKFMNKVGASGTYPNIPTADLDEIRNQGMVSIYRGTPIVILPNYLKDETNTEWLFDEKVAMILPVNEKPVKVAFRGELFTVENNQPHGGVQYDAHRLMGVGILFNNQIAKYVDTSGS